MENFYCWVNAAFFRLHKGSFHQGQQTLIDTFQKDKTSWSWKKYPRVSDSKVGQETFGQKQAVQLVPVACWMPCHHNSPPSYHYHANHQNSTPAYHHHANHHHLPDHHHHLAAEGASCTSSQLNALPALPADSIKWHSTSKYLSILPPSSTQALKFYQVVKFSRTSQ